MDMNPPAVASMVEMKPEPSGMLVMAPGEGLSRRSICRTTSSSHKTSVGMVHAAPPSEDPPVEALLDCAAFDGSSSSSPPEEPQAMGVTTRHAAAPKNQRIVREAIIDTILCHPLEQRAANCGAADQLPISCRSAGAAERRAHA